MASIHVHAGDSTKLTLEKALLFYLGEPASASCITIHPAIHSAGGASLGPGHVPGTAEIQQLLMSVLGARQPGLSLLSPRILAASLTTLVWHRPPAPAPLWFRVADFQDDKKKSTKNPLNKIRGDKFPQPHLLFICHHGKLSVFALASKPVAGHAYLNAASVWPRPHATTRLYKAPYYNVHEQGHLCHGSMQIPDLPMPSEIDAIETAFFQSYFTHQARPGLLHKYVPGAAAYHLLWPYVRKQKHFPKDLLIPEPRKTTLGKVLASL